MKSFCTSSDIIVFCYGYREWFVCSLLKKIVSINIIKMYVSYNEDLKDKEFKYEK